MGGRASRIKGHSFEREIAIKLRKYYPGARRGLQYRDGAECSDVIGTPWFIECKRHRKVSIQQAAYQAEQAKPGSQAFLVVSKDDRGKLLVTMEWEEFERFLYALDEGSDLYRDEDE